jgi:hypothetical protein
MATWLCHLEIADSLLADFSSLSRRDLLTGSIAPDCGVFDAGTGRFVPDKRTSHFHIVAGPISENRPHNCNEEHFWNQYLHAAIGGSCNERTSFLLGYFTHLVVDNLWAHSVGIPTKTQFIYGAEDTENAWRLVKSDWYDADVVRIQRDSPSSAWAFFSGIRAPESHINLMPTDNVRSQFSRIVSRYSQTPRPCEGGNLPLFPYFSPAQADAFVALGSEVVGRIIRNQLNPDSTHATGFVSFLQNHDFSRVRHGVWA